MKRTGKYIARLLTGMCAGIAAEHLLSYILSIHLRLGYYAPCLVTLPEMVGGELNAMALQIGAFALSGGLAGIATALPHHR